MENKKLSLETLGRKSVEEAKNAPKTPLILILDNIRSLNNVGAIFRTADAFLIEKIYLCGITATPPHRDIHKTALGATESVAWTYADDALAVVESLKAAGCSVWAIEQTAASTDLQDFRLPKQQKTAFVLGNEVKGVQQAVIDAAGQSLEIPQIGVKHSLNVSVTTGVVCWDFYSKMMAEKAI